jgi:tRNA threonylcarbamoyladenosine biosynthesis protein TsaE
MRKQVITHNETETIQLGVSIANNLHGGEIFLLESDLGGGKTAFTRGLAQGLGSSDGISSPTFVLSHIYEGRLALHHYDLYRLGEMGLMSDELQEAVAGTSAVIAIEWPQLAEATLPKGRLIHVFIDRQKTGENDRAFILEYPEKLGYLFEEKK